MKIINTISPLLLNPVAETAGNVAVDPATPTQDEEKIIVVNPDSGVEEEYLKDDDGRPYIIKEGIRLTIHEFGGGCSGILYHVATFENLDIAMQKHGASKILDALNDSMESGTRRKVKRTKIAAYEDEAAQKAWVKKTVEAEPMQFSQADALAFVPGEKELTSNQLTHSINDAIKNGAPRSKIRLLMDQLMEVGERERKRRGFMDEDES